MCISHVTICESSGKAHSSQEFEDSFYFTVKGSVMRNETFSFSSFYQRTALVCLAFVPFVECTVVEIVDRYLFDKNKLSGHVVSCCYTVHDVLRLY